VAPLEAGATSATASPFEAADDPAEPAIQIRGAETPGVRVILDAKYVPDTQIIKEPSGWTTLQLPESLRANLKKRLDVDAALSKNSRVIDNPDQPPSVSIRSDRLQLEVGVPRAKSKSASAKNEASLVVKSNKPAPSLMGGMPTASTTSAGLTGLLGTSASFLPGLSASSLVQHASTPTAVSAQTGLKTLGEAKSPTAPATADIPPPAAQAPASPASTQPTAAVSAKNAFRPLDIPLETLDRQRKAVIDSNALYRLIGGMVIILGLAAWWLRRQQRQSIGLSRAPMDAQPTAMAPPAASASPWGWLAAASSTRAGAPSTATRPSATMQLLSKMTLGPLPMQLLASTGLGKGKELHLVQVKDRYLVLATTGEKIQLLSDFQMDETGTGTVVGGAHLPAMAATPELLDEATLAALDPHDGDPRLLRAVAQIEAAKANDPSEAEGPYRPFQNLAKRYGASLAE
jgi:flagellar biogenesis protein FliO